MPHRRVPCPTKGCKNLKEATAKTCSVCRLKERTKDTEARSICPGYGPHKCGGRKDPDSEMCQVCRRLQAREERDARMRRQHEERAAADARIAAGQPNETDVLKEETSELRSRVRQLEETVKTYRSKTRVEDALVSNIREFIEKNPYRPQLRAPRQLKLTGKAAPHEMWPVISDAHYPERVDPAAAYGISYDGDICLRRMEKVRDAVIRYKDLRASAYPVQKIVCAVNGDMLSGNIHEELEVTNELPIGEAMVKMAYALYDMGKAFAEEVPNVDMIVMPGNHPRLERKPRMKNAWNNWEWVMGMFIQALARDQFTVIVPKDLVYRHKAFNQVIGLTHGDGVKAQAFAGIPWYSMKQRRDAMQALLKSLGMPQLDLLIYGHFHQLIYEEGSGCGMLINGSIKGYDEFILKTKYSGQTPIQALLTFHPRHGLTDLSRINLGHVQGDQQVAA